MYEAIILSVAALVAAWAGFQAAKWSGVQAASFSAAGAERVEATQLSSLSGQQALNDVVTVTSWLEALEEEGTFTDAASGEVSYVPAPDTRSGLLYRTFRPELAAAVDAWLATGPLTNPDSPLTPLDMPQYRLTLADSAAALAAEAEEQAAAGRTANQRSDSYVVMTVLLATVLLFVGIGSKMDTLRVRLFLLVAASTLLVGIIVAAAVLPKEI